MAGERPAWSPDGRRIAFQRDGNVHVIGIEGTGETVLGVGREPAWAPGGTRLAFAGSEGIAVMREDGSALRPACATTSATTPTPSRTWGRQAGLVACGRPHRLEHRGDGELIPAQIFVMNADGSHPRRVTPTQGIQYAESDPAWSPDGGAEPAWFPDAARLAFGRIDVASSGAPATQEGP